MGIHGNATCQMVLEDAVGTLVSEPGKGPQAMFVMMNAARLGVGNQSLGLTEVAFQNALAYAKGAHPDAQPDRPQGDGQAGRPDHRASRRAPNAAHRQGLGRSARARCCASARCSRTRELHHPDEKVRSDSAELLALR